VRSFCGAESSGGRHGKHCRAAEARHLAAVLVGVAAEEPEQAVHAAGLSGSTPEQPAVQLRAAVVVGSDTAERRRGASGAHRARES